jgi:hypothetical protein
MRNKERNNGQKFILEGPLEEFIQSQTYFNNGFCDVYVGGWRFERNKDDPEHEYRLCDEETMRMVRDHFKNTLSPDVFKDMDSYFFVSPGQGYSNTYTMFKIEKGYKNYDWKSFIKRINYNSRFGLQEGHFQQALQENGVGFIKQFDLNERQFKEWMEVPYNKENIIVLVGYSGNY